MCVRIERYHVVGHRKGDIGQNKKKVKNVENDFLTEMYRRDPPLSKTVDSISKCCIFIHYQLKIQDDNCLRDEEKAYSEAHS